MQAKNQDNKTVDNEQNRALYDSCSQGKVQKSSRELDNNVLPVSVGLADPDAMSCVVSVGSPNSQIELGYLVGQHGILLMR